MIDFILIYLLIGLGMAVIGNTIAVFVPNRVPSLKSFVSTLVMWPVAVLTLVAVAVLLVVSLLADLFVMAARSIRSLFNRNLA